MMKASQAAMFIKANRRALSTRLASAGRTERATSFSPGTEVACQSRANCVCSGVRVEPVFRPKALTSFKSAAYCALLKSGGGPGRNCAPLVRAKGVMEPKQGNEADLVPSGTERHCPILVPP